MNDFYSVKFPRSRKQHRCEICGRMIAAKRKYVKVSQVYEGIFRHTLSCKLCQALIWALFKLIPDLDDGMDYAYAREIAGDFIKGGALQNHLVRVALLRAAWRQELREMPR